MQRKAEVFLPWHTGGGGLNLRGVRCGTAELVKDRLVAAGSQEESGAKKKEVCPKLEDKGSEMFFIL